MVKIKDSDINIYLIDDDELLNKILLTKFQQNTTYNVYTYTSGDDFIQFYHSQPNAKKQFHIVILDYLLKPLEPAHSTKNGIDFLQEFKQLNPEIQVILISAVENPDISIQAQKYGAAAFIKKNENSFLRIHNQINFLISEIKLQQAHKRSLTTRYLFLTLLLVFIIIFIFVFISEILT